MKQICCSHCGEKLIEVPAEDSVGTIAAKVRAAGFLPKNPFLYTGKSQWLNFCSHECKMFYYLDVLQIPKEKMDDVTSRLNEVKKDIPRWANETAKAVQALHSQLTMRRDPE